MVWDQCRCCWFTQGPPPILKHPPHPSTKPKEIFFWTLFREHVIFTFQVFNTVPFSKYLIMNKYLVLNEQILFLEMGNDPQMMLMIVESWLWREGILEEQMKLLCMVFSGRRIRSHCFRGGVCWKRKQREEPTLSTPILSSPIFSPSSSLPSPHSSASLRLLRFLTFGYPDTVAEKIWHFAPLIADH